MENSPVHFIKKQLFVRLLVMYHIVILPIVLLGLYLYMWSYNNASEEISRHASSQMKAYLNDLDREIEWIESQQYDLLNADELGKVALTWDRMDGVEKKINMFYITNRLISLKSTSAHIHNIYIHIPSISKSISALTGVNDFEINKYKMNQLKVGELYSYLSKEEDASLQLNSNIMNKYIDGEPAYSIQTELDQASLRESLDALKMYEQNESFLLNGDRQLLWSSSGASDTIMQAYEQQRNGSHGVIEIDQVNYHFDEVYSESRNLYLISYLPEAMVKKPLRHFKNWVWVFSIITILALSFFAYFTYRHVHKPLLVLVDGFKRMENGHFDQKIEHKKTDEFGFIYNRYNSMLEKLKTLIDKNYKQTMMVQKAELKQLQSQINPHFLYNSFFIINSLAKTENTEKIEDFTKMLGEYYKFITRSEDYLVPLIEEMSHARMYTEIQNMRFSRRIKVQFDELQNDMEQIMVPKLIVQPIIENAYKYSLEKMRQKGFLRVSVQSSENEVLITVEDNGQSITNKEIEKLTQQIHNIQTQQELSALMNIHRRIVLTYRKGSGLFLSKSKLNGLKVTIRLILEEEEKDV
ncbi:sensor histidine kinase [Gracilibacillus alcaliphilus]|uniref:sensor histidine kinase n=1 Tax=Gracilibacillus alcaliphilus TaxID=1401441 RepID=UPI00195CD0EC|nr:histidine kinase [Gracilibacillus alcaliphilus]MBM7677696.1 two-component system sensor histidine kinase YesM [Gracilibacillus alcaliphilus]